MGKLVKNHLARLIALAAAVIQFMAALQGYFWPKIFWDFLTKSLDGAVKPIPLLQSFNLLFSLLTIVWELPLKPLARGLPAAHRSIEARLVIYPLFALAAILMYQSTNAALYYLIAIGIYFWAFCEGEVVCPEPWALPKRPSTAAQRQMKHYLASSTGVHHDYEDWC